MLSRSMDPSQATQLRNKQDLTEHDAALQNNLLTRSIEVDKESDDGLDYQEDEHRNSGSELSKKRIIIRNNFNQSSTRSKALGKL